MQLKSELISCGFLTESQVGKYHKIGDIQLHRKLFEIRSMDDYQINVKYIVDHYIISCDERAVITLSFKNLKRICSVLNFEEKQSLAAVKSDTNVCNHGSVSRLSLMLDNSMLNVEFSPVMSGTPATPATPENGASGAIAQNYDKIENRSRGRHSGGIKKLTEFISAMSSSMSFSDLHNTSALNSERLSVSEEDLIVNHLLVLDNAVHEVLGALSSDSFSRFVLTEEYKKLIQM